MDVNIISPLPLNIYYYIIICRAPEAIEMRGHISTSCDIWSVGCTIIELLTGNPPYYDLLQYPALFRMVEDDHPPLPEGISE